jgi:uncharacterized protein (DUF362 family)
MKRLGLDLSLINLSNSPTTLVKIDDLYFKKLELPRILVSPNYFISIAVAKTHELDSITGVMKNLFSLIPRKDQQIYHPYIHEVITDLNRIVKLDLCIIDARIELKGWMGPKKRQLDTFIVGKNPVAVDAILAKTMGLKPSQIKHLVEAERIGLGSLNPKILR